MFCLWDLLLCMKESNFDFSNKHLQIYIDSMKLGKNSTTFHKAFYLAKHSDILFIKDIKIKQNMISTFALGECMGNFFHR